MARATLTDLTIASALVLAVASLVVADTGLTIPTECPKTDEGNVTVNLAHENDCTKYYGCSGGKKWLKECPLRDAEGNRLHFNPILQVCDWPENVNCKLPNGRSAVMLKIEVRVECPKVDPLNQTIHLAHETDCTKFYKCGNGVKYEMDCPVFDDEGHKLYFNETLELCDWPWNVDCKVPETMKKISKVPKSRETVMLAAEIPTECPKNDPANKTIHLAHETDCTKFYKCSHGVKHVMDCPVFNDEGERLYFNVTLELCDWPWNVDCKESKPMNFLSEVLTPRKTVALVSEVPTKCPKVDQVNQTVHLAHETDCTKFYKCGNGVKYEMDCPVFDDEGHKLYFNETLELCDWPWNVDCKVPETMKKISKVPKSRETVMLAAEIPTECPKNDPANKTIHLAHETDCTKFYKCSHGVKHVMDCPVFNDEGDKLYFNVTLELCDWPWNVDCKESKPMNFLSEVLTPRKTVALVSEVPTKCPKVDQVNQTVHLAHETDCTKFYKCGNGVKYEMDCPVFDDEGNKLYFNVTLQLCDWPWNVDCKVPETMKKISKVPKSRETVMLAAEIPTQCPKVDPADKTVNLAHETDCTKYYACSHGKKWLMDCPYMNEAGDKLHFNAESQLCDFPENANCKL